MDFLSNAMLISYEKFRKAAGTRVGNAYFYAHFFCFSGFSQMI
jgi:hypothetical protein